MNAVQMIEQLKRVRSRAYAPYSNYAVAAMIEAASGQFYEGCNVENAAYGLTQCAEASAIGQMVTAGDQQIRAIWILGTGEKLCTPCGACRQRVREFANSSTTVYLCDEQKVVKKISLDSILPLSFESSMLS